MFSRIALVDLSSLVTNVIRGDINTYTPPAGVTLVADDEGLADIGGTYVEGVFYPPVVARPPDPTPADTPLTMRQLRLGLLLIGGFSASFIQDAINAIPDATQRGVAQIWYDESATVDWSHPMTQQLIAGAGLTTEQAAAMWMQAKDLDA